MVKFVKMIGALKEYYNYVRLLLERTLGTWKGWTVFWGLFTVGSFAIYVVCKVIYMLAFEHEVSLGSFFLTMVVPFFGYSSAILAMVTLFCAVLWTVDFLNREAQSLVSRRLRRVTRPRRRK